MRRSDTAQRETCPIARAAQLLGDHWTLLLLRDLSHGSRRFQELLHSTGMSPAVLSSRLRHLERAGMVTRRQFAEIPPRVEYTLTEMGLAALPLVEQLRQFGETWLATMPAPPLEAADHAQPSEPGE